MVEVESSSGVSQARGFWLGSFAISFERECFGIRFPTTFEVRVEYSLVPGMTADGLM